MPRALVDDSTSQWTGTSALDSVSLQRAVHAEEVSKVDAIVKPV